MTCVFTDDKNNQLHLDFYAQFESDTDDYGMTFHIKLKDCESFIEMHFNNNDIAKISNLLSDWVANKEWTKNILRHG